METVADIARRLADNAEAVCRRYLSNGRREGRYWLVGDVRNTPGRSLYVRLSGSGESDRNPGKWTDAESGDHGDLLDVIAASCGHDSLRETLAEARRFLSLPRATAAEPSNPRTRKMPGGTPVAARRLWNAARPIADTLAARYLAGRHIRLAAHHPALRFHRSCYYRASHGDAPDVRASYPAMIASVTDLEGNVMGIHRTWLDREGGKAKVACPRRAMGQLLGHGVRFGAAAEVMAAGEGIETILSLREILPAMGMIAGLSAAHLAAIHFPAPLRRLYVACDRDAAGKGALATLEARAADHGIEVVPLIPARDDFNGDLCAMGRDAFAARVARLLHGEDARRLLAG
jgi:hypothetical protein